MLNARPNVLYAATSSCCPQEQILSLPNLFLEQLLGGHGYAAPEAHP
jgi:hypothetical protein